MTDPSLTEEIEEKVRASFGFVPNLMAGILEQNPAVADAYLQASAALAGGSLTAKEKQAVMLAVSAFNDCHYCTAAHRTAGKAMGVSQADLEAIDNRRTPSDPRLAGLVKATWRLMSDRGWLDQSRIDALGVSRPDLYEIIAIVGLKTISNYINHIQQTEIDEPLKAQAKREIRRSA